MEKNDKEKICNEAQKLLEKIQSLVEDYSPKAIAIALWSISGSFIGSQTDPELDYLVQVFCKNVNRAAFAHRERYPLEQPEKRRLKK